MANTSFYSRGLLKVSIHLSTRDLITRISWYTSSKCLKLKTPIYPRERGWYTSTLQKDSFFVFFSSSLVSWL